jgi:hypothetical protein
MLRRVRAYMVASLGLALASSVACSAQNASDSASSDDPVTDPAELEAANEAIAHDQWAGLFKDGPDFAIKDLREGHTDCSDIIQRAADRNGNVVPDAFLPWPAELKAFLVAELEQFPARSTIFDSVAGYYLVKGKILYDGSPNNPTAGLACDRGDHKGLIFLSERTFVTQRQGAGLGKWQEIDYTADQFVRVHSGDNAALTLIHESMHAIDTRHFRDGNAGVARRAAMEQSWVNATTPRSNRIATLALDNGVKARLPNERGRACSWALTAGRNLSLAAGNRPPTAKELADGLRYLAEKTNFIVPYTEANSAEDWAESLTVYYYGTLYRGLDGHGSWQRRVVKDGKKELYTADTERIAQQPQHVSKLCGLARLVFGRCALAPAGNDTASVERN